MTDEDRWSVAYTKHAMSFIESNVTSERVARKIFQYRELLESFPDLGRPYDPDYPAARPPFPCRQISIPDTPFTLYYLKEEDNKRIVIFTIEYDRASPNARFSRINWAIAPF